MEEAIISTLVESLGALILDQTSKKVNLVRGVDKEVVILRDDIKIIKDEFDSAQKRGENEPKIKNWLKKVEHMVYEMEDILDEWNYSRIEHMKQNVRTSLCLCFKTVSVHHDIAMKIQNVKVKYDQIWKERDGFKFEKSQPATDHVPKPLRLQSTSFIDEKKVYGIGTNDNKKDLVRRMMLNNDRQIVSIVGMGGLGKTTLAQLVFNDPQVVKKDCFEFRIWICVSNSFDVAGIASDIIENVTQEIIPPSNQLEVVLQKLKDCISEKKFLLVLDDVWIDNPEEWKQLKINLKHGAAGSKILVTTRKEKVAKMMGTLHEDILCPKPLSPEECWSLLRGVSLEGRSEEDRRKLEHVGEKIATKCDGLPLAANVLGSLLQYKDSLEEWEKVLETEIWQLEEEEEEKVKIFPHLALSYNELSSTLKSCFSYLVVYPKDYRICAVNVIDEWMALGYLGSVVGNVWVELKGRDYFNNLAMRSLLHDLEKSGEQIEWCKMHDIVHDFALFLRKNNTEMKKASCQVYEPCLASEAQEYRSLFWDKKTPLVICDCITSLRVLRFIKGAEGGPPQRLERLIHLRLLDLRNAKLSKEELKIICRLYLLQTLLLACCSLKEIPKEIGNLDGLRNLDLSENELIKLPESINKLLGLQTLSLRKCSLKEIPKELGDLVGLRKLDLSENELIKSSESICSLYQLHTLSLAYCSLEEIGKKIMDMVGLRNLDLSFNKELKELPESICVLVKLQILNLTGCSNLNGLPQRIHMLQNLQQLLIEGTPVSNRMPAEVGQLSGLRALKLGVFKVGSGGEKLGLLKNLNYLAGSLTLDIELSSMSDLEELVEDAREAELKNKTHLHSLSIGFKDKKKNWSSSSTSTSLWMNVIEALEPNQKLKDLEIWGYRGSNFPYWISSPFNSMKEIRLSDFSEVSSLPHLGKLPLLESLEMRELGELKVVGRDFLGIESSSTQDVAAFPKLKKLIFFRFMKWEEWEDITVEEEESATVSIMPFLTHLNIVSCVGLKKLPHCLVRKFSSLKFLDISNSLLLEKSYGENDDSPWKSISQHNTLLRLTRSS